MAAGLVTTAQHRDLPEAGLAKSKLEAAGIPCFLDNEYTVGVNWHYSIALGGLKLNVPEECAEEAKAKLRKELNLLLQRNPKNCCRAQRALPAGLQK